MKRGVGYCMDEECEEYTKGVFLLNHGPRYFCNRCRVEGIIEAEHGSEKLPGDPIFREVRVNYDFDPIELRYRCTAIVRNDDIEVAERNVYTLSSPLIKTEKRGLKVAEATLSNLEYARLDGAMIPKITEHIIQFDASSDEWKRQMEDLENRLASSPRMQMRNLRK